MHALRCDAVHATFGLTDEPERPNGAFLDPLRNGRLLDQAHQLAHVAPPPPPPGWLVGDRELHLLAGHAAPHDVAHCNPDAGQPEACR